MDQWIAYGSAIARNLTGAAAKPLFQGCNFEAPRHLGYNETQYWNVENALADGMAGSGLARAAADHEVSRRPTLIT